MSLARSLPSLARLSLVARSLASQSGQAVACRSLAFQSGRTLTRDSIIVIMMIIKLNSV
jgi:hypothetical protein